MNVNSGQLRTPIPSQGKTVNQQATRGHCNRLRMERIRDFMIMHYINSHLHYT